MKNICEELLLKVKRQRDQRKIKALCVKAFPAVATDLNTTLQIIKTAKNNKNIPYEVYAAPKNPFEFRNKEQKTNDDTNNFFSIEQVNIFCKISEKSFSKLTLAK